MVRETVVDSSCPTDLCAAGPLAVVLPQIGLRFLIPLAVGREAHCLRRRKGDLELARIDLRDAIEAGLLER